jgi:type IX secretion system PorP/SprF family membrane protein
MKRILLTIITLGIPLYFYGQMSVLSDQYINNTMIYNPAYAGSQDALSISVLYRNQWVGFEDAPRNYALTLHTPVRNDRIGIGFFAGNCSFSVYRETSFMGDYAYRMEMFGGTLALGLGLGATIKYVNWNDLYAADANDILLTNYPESAFLPDFSIGTYYYTKTFFLGVSLPDLLSHDLNPKTQKYSISPALDNCNYYLEAGYFLNKGHQIKVLPSFLLKYHPGHTPQIDVSAQMFLGERIGLGFGYRNKNTLLGLLQLHLNRQLMISYSYSFDTGKVGQFNNGSHEMVLNYLFNYSSRMTSPRQF